VFDISEHRDKPFGFEDELDKIIVSNPGPVNEGLDYNGSLILG